MWRAFWTALISALHDLAGVFGIMGAVTVVALFLAAVLFLLYMILIFGDRGTEMFLPFLREALKALRSESTKTHPAIRLEMRFQYFIGTIVAFCLLVTLLHALIPWLRDTTEQVFLGTLVTSGILFVVLAGISLTLSLRLK